MQQLSGVDAAFLHLETGSTFGHVGALVLLETSTPAGPLTFDAVRTVVEQRLPLLPPLRRRLVEVPLGVDRPYWADDPDFDLDFHVREVGLPSPGTPQQLAEQVARIAARPLDRRRPLWEVYLLWGVQDDRAALLVKFHHAALDGVAGAELVTTLLDQSPDVPQPAAPPPWRPAALPNQVEMWARGVVGASFAPLRALDLQRRVLTGLPRSAARLSRVGAAAASTAMARPGDGQLLSWPGVAPPKTSFNRPVTPHRRYAYGSVPLEDVKAVKNAFGTTVNDVVMAACAGGLRRWLQAHRELPAQPLLAMVPVSTRTQEQQGQFGNQVSAMVAALPTHLADPVERLQAVHQAMRVAKEQHAAIDARTLQDMAQLTLPAIATRAARVAAQLRLADVVAPPYNVVVSNVPGPRTPLYLAGAQMVGYFPVSMVTDGLGLNLTVQSYLDHLDLGFLACRELVPDLWDLLGHVQASFGELAERAAATAT